MRAILLITGRELAAFLKSMSGYVIAAVVLAIDALLFHAFALGGGERLSSDVLQNFFYFSAGTTMIASILVSMRVIAEERHDNTLVLLYTAPVDEWQIAVGKWLSAFLFVALLVLLSLYMPLLVVVRGNLNPGHLVAGYVGLLLLASASTALGTFASALTRSQVVAGVIAAALVVGLLITWILGRVVDPPFDEIFSYLALFDKHFVPFQRGAINTRSVVYYLSVTFFSLLMTREVLGARRWR